MKIFQENSLKYTQTNKINYELIDVVITPKIRIVSN